MTTVVMTAALVLALSAGYFVGRARGIEHAGLLWLAAVRRIESSWESTAKIMRDVHLVEAGALTAALRHARAANDILRARLDETAVPRDRGN